jgi:hypothetical protein
LLLQATECADAGSFVAGDAARFATISALIPAEFLTEVK